MIDTLHSYNPFYILNLVYGNIRDIAAGRGSSHWWSDYFLNFYYGRGYILILISLFFSLAMIVFIMGVIFRINKIYSKQRKSLKPIKSAEEEKDGAVKNNKWKIIMEHIESENANDWRLAILESDIALGEMLDKLGYRGESIGDQLKGVDKSNFITIDDAWEAHKIRNSIAHEGASFLITEREAKRVIGLYKKVFEEHDYI